MADISKSPRSIAFVNRSKNREHNIYTEEFLGGADVYIYINGKRYEDITSIQYSIREQQKPIYGYSSRLFDDIATGVRIVQGMIRVPVRNTTYNEDISVKDPEIETVQASAFSTDALASVPGWAYNYNFNNQNIQGRMGRAVIPNVSNSQSSIANVQSKLRERGYNIDVTGIVDTRTKMSIYRYKRDNDLTANNKCDNELLYSLGLNVDSITINENSKLLYEPNDSSISCFDILPGTKAIVINNIDDKWMYVKTENDKKGYLKKTEVL